MTAILDDFFKLKKEIEDLKETDAKNKGMMSHVLQQLKEEYSCHDLRAAKEKLRQLELTERALLATYVERRKRFQKKWKKLLKSKPL